MNPIPRQKINSSDIASHGYDAESQTLDIEFHSTGVYRYFSVPAEVYKNFCETPSAGKFFLSNIKGKFAWEKVKLTQ